MAGIVLDEANCDNALMSLHGFANEATCVFGNLTGTNNKLFLKAALYLQKTCHSDIKVDDNIYMELNINKILNSGKSFEYGV